MRPIHPLWIFLPIVLLITGMTFLVPQDGQLRFISIYFLFPAVFCIILAALGLALASLFRPK